MMAKEKLTKRFVDRLEPREKDYIVFDEDLPGFGVRIMPSGKRFYLIQYRRHGRTRRVMIGQHGPVTAEIARREANRMLGAVRGGGDDPATLRDMERQAATIPELGARFLKEHVEVRCKPSTQYEYRRAVEIFINPFFGKQRVRTVTSADAAELHGRYAHTPYQSNRVLGVLSKMMNLAEVWGMRDRRTNPCDDVRPFQSASVSASCRRRRLSAWARPSMRLSVRARKAASLWPPTGCFYSQAAAWGKSSD